jgi:hypothetical protein
MLTGAPEADQGGDLPDFTGIEKRTGADIVNLLIVVYTHIFEPSAASSLAVHKRYD